jgi:hypothetical protein
MTTKHKLRAFLPVGDRDLGAEIEAELAFSFTPGSADYYNRRIGTWEQGWGEEIELISAEPYCNGKPAPFLDYAAFQQDSLNELAAQWLESDVGRAAALVPVSGVDAYRMSTDAANITKAIVVKTALEIQGRKYVRVEGWQSIALAHGCTASSCDVERVEGGFRATGQVRRLDTGAVIAEAEGFVGEDEPVWFGGEVVKFGKKKIYDKRPDYAIRAMAQTRAISRACRSAFAHVVVMMDAGLQTTPAEEVPFGGFDDGPNNAGNAQERSLRIDPADQGMVQGDGRSQYQVDKEKKAKANAVATLKASAKLALGLCHSRAELKAWWMENKPALEDGLPASEFDRMVEAVDARWDELPAPEKVA